eukprot:2792584-Amphidinium_carterae.1
MLGAEAADAAVVQRMGGFRFRGQQNLPNVRGAMRRRGEQLRQRFAVADENSQLRMGVERCNNKAKGNVDCRTSLECLSECTVTSDICRVCPTQTTFRPTVSGLH